LALSNKQRTEQLTINNSWHLILATNKAEVVMALQY
jgi:hypothetical protein